MYLIKYLLNLLRVERLTSGLVGTVTAFSRT